MAKQGILTDIFLSLILVFKHAYLGFLNGIYAPLKSLFDASSKSVDSIYKSTVKNNPYKNIKEVKVKPISPRQQELLNAKKHELQKELANEDTKANKKTLVYIYTAKSPTGKLVKERFSAFSKTDVNSYLVNEGYDVYSIETSPWINFVYGEGSFGSRKWKTKDLIFWLTQLSTYIKAGITLTDAVKILINQMGKDKGKRRTMESLAYELTMGESFSNAMEKQGNVFPNLLINMIKAAEATGGLEETLDDMANYYNEIEKTKKQMVSAMTYPVIVMVFALAVITFILLYIVPQFVEIYESLDVELSGLTLFLLNLSTFMQANVVYLLLSIIAVLAIFIFMYKKIKAFRRLVQVIMMHIPVVGNIVIYNEITIFTKTFASLLKNNVFITETIDILSKITNNEIYKEIMFNTINNIAKGDKISEAFKDHWAVPEVAYYMIVTGESTGQLAEMMGRVSDYYQTQHQAMIESIKSLIEPVLIVSLAVIVGVILIAVVIPMFGFYQEMSTQI